VLGPGPPIVAGPKAALAPGPEVSRLNKGRRVMVEVGLDPLWIPILTHYGSRGGTLNRARCEAQVSALEPDVRQLLIAGTTGDGWQMDDTVLDQWLDLASTSPALTKAHTLLFGVFAPDTGGVISRARRIEAHFAVHPSEAAFAGLTICAPMRVGNDQGAILAHFEAVLAATTSPVAVYELPQVTGSSIAPSTFKALLETSPRIRMFKDSSGDDAIAQAGLDRRGAMFLRGAEGDYLRHARPRGPYDGWLLSTANGFAPSLRRLADSLYVEDAQDAADVSQRLTDTVARIFERAADLAEGNAFSNASRAADHILAYGARGGPPPRLGSGNFLPEDFIHDVAALMMEGGFAPMRGYLN